VIGTVVGQVEVVGQVGVFRSDRVDAFDRGKDAQLLAVSANAEQFLFHIAGGTFNKTGNLEIGETKALGFFQHVSGQVFNVLVSTKDFRIVEDVFEFAQEPGVNLGQFIDTVDGIAGFKSLCYGKHAQVGGF